MTHIERCRCGSWATGDPESDVAVKFIRGFPYVLCRYCGRRGPVSNPGKFSYPSLAKKFLIEAAVLEWNKDWGSDDSQTT